MLLLVFLFFSQRSGTLSAGYTFFEGVEVTSFFPLQFIGDKTTGFKGEMKNLMVKQEKYLNLLYNPARFLK